MVPTHKQIKVNRRFLQACSQGNLKEVKELLFAPKTFTSYQCHADIHAEKDMGFINACKNGHLEVVRFLLTSPEIVHHGYTYPDINAHGGDPLAYACFNGHWAVADFLLNAKELLHTNADVYASNGYCLVWACTQNHLDIVKLLVHEMHRHPPHEPLYGEPLEVQDILNRSLLNACQYGHIDIVRYLLVGSDYPDMPRADLHHEDEKCLKRACVNNQLAMVKYLSTSPELAGINHANIHVNDNECFKDTIEQDLLEMGRFLIIEGNLELTPDIDSFLRVKERESPHPLREIFSIKQLYMKMNNHLDEHDSQRKKKVKI